MMLVIPENFWMEVASFSAWEMLGLRCENDSSWLCCRLQVGLGLDFKAPEPRLGACGQSRLSALAPPCCNRFVSLVVAMGPFCRHCPSLCIELHYSLGASLLLLYQFLFWSSDLSCQHFPVLLRLGGAPKPCRASPSPAGPMQQGQITALFMASQSGGLPPSFLWGLRVKAFASSLAPGSVFPFRSGFLVMLWGDEKYLLLLPGQAL